MKKIKVELDYNELILLRLSLSTQKVDYMKDILKKQGDPKLLKLICNDIDKLTKKIESHINKLGKIK